MPSQFTIRLISCGDELLFGHTVDTNASWLATQCNALGWRVEGKRTVPDVVEDIAAAVTEAAGLADAVILTGGLGPTEDDRSRQAMSKVLDSPLEERPELVEAIQAIFRSFGREMTPINRVQAMIPRAAQAIPNPAGTAPGIQAQVGRATVYVLPGVPREVYAMFAATIAPQLQAKRGPTRQALRRLHLIGMGESDVGEAIRDLMRERANPEVGTTVADSIVTIRIFAKGDSEEEAERLARDAEDTIRKRLGGHIFDTDGDNLSANLAARVIDLLRERNAVLTLAESCTGGMLSSMIVDVPGSSDVFREGIVAYANEAKMARLGVPALTLEKYGAVSAETAEAMARGVWAADAPSAYSLAVTGIAGPGGGTPEKPVGLVYIACGMPDGSGGCRVQVITLRSPANRLGIRLRSAHQALDLLRRSILGIPLPYRGGECAGASCGKAS